MCPAVLTAQHRPLGKHGKALQCYRPVKANSSICQNTVVERQVDTVVVPVKGHRLHIDIGIQKVSAANLCAGTAIQYFLAALGQIYPQILDTILIPAAVSNLLRMNRKGLPQVIGAAAHTSITAIRHGEYLLYWCIGQFMHAGKVCSKKENREIHKDS